MGTEYTSVRLTEDAYEKLRARKRSDESFSDAVERLAGERSLLDLVGLFSDEEVAEIESALAERGERYRRELEREWRRDAGGRGEDRREDENGDGSGGADE